MYCPDGILGFTSVRMAAWLFEKMVHLLRVFVFESAFVAIWSASYIPLISAAYIVDVVVLPMYSGLLG